MSIIEVARLAGVSTATVSRVMNNLPRVSEETTKSVRAAMEQLGYAPSARRRGPKARALTDNRGVSTLGLLVSGTAAFDSTPMWAAILRGVAQEATRQRVGLMLFYVSDDDSLPDQLQDAKTDGLLLFGPPPSPALKERLNHLPAVSLMASQDDAPWGDKVVPDYYSVGSQAAEYLLKQGHEHLAYLNLDAKRWSNRLAGHGFAVAAHAQGKQAIAIEATGGSSAPRTGNVSPDLVGEVIERLIKRTPRPTGLFIPDDAQTAILQPALQGAGVRLGPGKVEIVSCNNDPPYLAGLNPRPAEIDIRPEAIGAWGVQRLIWRIANGPEADRQTTTVEPAVLRCNTPDDAHYPPA